MTEPVQNCSAGSVDALALADEYETSMNRALASGYEEFGPLWESQHRLVIKALRSFGAAQSVGMRAALERAQKIIERDFPNGQLAVDIRAVLASQPSPAATPGKCDQCVSQMACQQNGCLAHQHSSADTVQFTDPQTATDTRLILAAEYEAGLRKMEASGYEEWQKPIQSHKLIIEALRFQARSSARQEPVAFITKAALANFKRGSDPESHVLLRSGNDLRVPLYLNVPQAVSVTRLPGHDETMDNLDALTIRPQAAREKLRTTSFNEVSCEKPETECEWPECDCRERPRGTFACPICGKDTPHHHDVENRAECSGCMNPACEDCFDQSALAKAEERCPTCGRTDYEDAHVRMRCRDPWHADAHLRATSPLTRPQRGGVDV